MGRIQSRRPLYGRRAGKGGRGETLCDARPVRDSRTGVGRCHAGLLRYRHRRFGHVVRPHRRRRRASRYRRRLHYAEQPPRGRRQALFRLDRFGPGRSPLFRPEDPPRIPHHDVGLRIVHAGAVARRRGAGTGAADRLRQARLPCGGAGRRCRRADPGRAFETAAQRRESRPQAVGRREPRYGAFLGSRFAASGGGVPREAIPQGAQSGECP